MATLVSQHSYTGDINLPASSKPFALPFDFVKGDGESHQFNITVQNASEDVVLSAATCLFKIFRTADGATVSIAADVDGSVMSKAFTAECTAYAMPVYIMAVVTIGDIERTVWYASARVRPGASDVVVDPGSAVPSLGELLAAVADTEAATAAAEAATALIRYTFVKYSDDEPTADEDMQDEISAWIGVYNGTSSTAPTAYTSYDWYMIKGGTGDSFTILGTYADLAALRTAVPSPPVGVFYNVGASAPYNIYRATGEANPDDWEDQGTLQATTDAADMDITDSGEYFASDNVEGALQEVGADLADKLDISEVGIGDDEIVQMDDTDAESGDFAKFTANGLEGRSAAETLSDIGAQAAATITENADAAPALGTIANNTEYRCTHATPTAAPTMTIAAISANTTEFACNVIYKAKSASPAVPTVTNSSGKTIKYQGDDVASGTFVPVASTIYRLGWVWDGIYLNCYIKGVA